jgi:hypothetical protein
VGVFSSLWETLGYFAFFSIQEDQGTLQLSESLPTSPGVGVFLERSARHQDRLHENE